MRAPSTIRVWIYEATPPEISVTKNTMGALEKLVNLVVLFAALIFVVVNFDQMVRDNITRGELKFTYRKKRDLRFLQLMYKRKE